MTKEPVIKTRKLTEQEISRTKLDLAVRGWSSLFGAAMVVVFAVILTIRSMSLFTAHGNTAICTAAIWIAVVAVDFGMVRHGLQFLKWRKARHSGVVPTETVSGYSFFDDIFNIVSTVVFIFFGIAVLFTGKLGFGDLNTIPQIPLSLLIISFGLSSAESVAFHFRLRKAGLADVIHEIEEGKKTENKETT
ncbi:hypothetical protein DRQ36_07095 [bacterium]|nr:MAG: hypothetical protein DRQ36_07095 [bacterium]